MERNRKHPHNSKKVLLNDSSLKDFIFGDKKAVFRVGLEKSKDITDDARAKGVFTAKTMIEFF